MFSCSFISIQIGFLNKNKLLVLCLFQEKKQALGTNSNFLTLNIGQFFGTHCKVYIFQNKSTRGAVKNIIKKYKSAKQFFLFCGDYAAYVDITAEVFNCFILVKGTEHLRQTPRGNQKQIYKSNSNLIYLVKAYESFNKGLLWGGTLTSLHYVAPKISKYT